MKTLLPHTATERAYRRICFVLGMPSHDGIAQLRRTRSLPDDEAAELLQRYGASLAEEVLTAYENPTKSKEIG